MVEVPTKIEFESLKGRVKTLEDKIAAIEALIQSAISLICGTT